jgi:hypothetical protein
VPLLLGGDFRRRVDVERLRVVPDFVPLDLRAVDDFLVPADFVPAFALDDFARVVDRRVPLVADADLRVDAAFVPVDFRRPVDFALVFDFARDFDAPVDLRLDEADFRLDEADLRFVVDPRSVRRFVSPARTVVAFSSCATPFATSSCARATALSTGLRSLDRFDLVFFRGAIAALPSIQCDPRRRSMDCMARGVFETRFRQHMTPQRCACTQHRELRATQRHHGRELTAARQFGQDSDA